MADLATKTQKSRSSPPVGRFSSWLKDYLHHLPVTYPLSGGRGANAGNRGIPLSGKPGYRHQLSRCTRVAPGSLR